MEITMVVREMLEQRVRDFTFLMSELDPKLVCAMERFVLEFGAEREGVRFPHERGQIGLCFYNATHYALKHGLWYVEGYGTLPGFPLPFHHAWAEDDDGRIFDPTWSDPENRHYMGVRFRPLAPLARGAKEGEWSLLDSSVGPRFDFIAAEIKRRAA